MVPHEGSRRGFRTKVRYRTLVPAIAAVLLVCLGVRTEGQDTRSNQPLPRPQFEARAELVLVDVTVLGDDGQPVTNLTADDFSLEVNGQPRPIASAQFVSATPATTAAEPRRAGVSSNGQSSSGRLLLLAIDEGNIRFGAVRSVLHTAETMLDTLAPGDLVGLARLPDGAGGVEFTTDHERVRQALRKVTGKAAPQRGLGMVNLRLSEAMARESSMALEWDQVVARECGREEGPSRELCMADLENAAQSMVVEASADARRSIGALDGLLSRLAVYRTPVNVIFISEGLFIAQDRGALARIAARAAEARASFHIVQPGQSVMDAGTIGLAGSRFGDDALLSEGLESLAGQTRGALHKLEAGSGAGVFTRISAELSGYYLLGFEPTDDDRSGRERRIRVRAARRGLRLRARPTFAIRDARTATDLAATPEAMLTETLKAPLPATDVPVRVATYIATSAQAPKLRVVVAAELGEPTRESVEWPVAVIAVDNDGKVVAQASAKPTLAPARRDEPAPALFLTTLLLDPGDYTLRLATVTPDGRTGSVHHLFNAKLAAVGGRVNASDLLVSSAPSGEQRTLQPSPSAVIEGEALFVSMELSSAARGALDKAAVAYEVAASNTSAALLTQQSTQQARDDGTTKAYAARLALGVLPPGEYVARAIVQLPGADPVRLTRAFAYAPSPLTTEAAAAPANVDEDAVVPPPPSRILAPVPRFVPESALEPRVLGPILDALVGRHPPSASVAAIVEQARAGTFAAPSPDAGVPLEDELTLTFIRGLAALQKRSYSEAAGWFQTTLRGASDFLGAAYYLGVCHAARGQDREAVGAWQLSLIGEGAGVAYPPLVDALLRLGDGPQALEFLEEAPDAWADADERQWRRAIVDAMLGRFAPALDGLTPLLDRRPRDPDLLFVAIQLLYRRHIESPLNSSDIERFRTLTTRYREVAGPQIALVETWAAYALKPR